MKHLILAGAGHAHLAVLTNIRRFLEKDIEVTVISPDAYHYYSGMGPGMLSGIYRPQDVRFNMKKLVQDSGSEFIEGKVTKIFPQKKEIEMIGGKIISYDLASFNTGSIIPDGPFSEHENIVYVKPIVNLLNSKEYIAANLKNRRMKIVIAGGGAAGVEIAANLRRLAIDNNGQMDICLISGSEILPRFDKKVRRLALKSLLKKEIEIIENSMVSSVKEKDLVLNNGKTVRFDIAFNAIGIKPSPVFRESGIPTGEDGGLLVNKYLQSIEYPEIFGGGDAISFKPRSLDKVGVFAVRQNSLLLNNLLAAAGWGKLREFIPQKKYLGILNMGDGRGLFFRGSFVFEGRFAFIFKNYLDNSFMKKFQVSGERDE